MADKDSSSMEEKLELAMAMAKPSHGVEERSREINEDAPLKKPRLEKDSEVYFDLKKFEACVTSGEWNEAEEYLSGFLKIDEDPTSVWIFFDIRELKYLEALDRKDYTNAVEILKKDLKSLAVYNEDRFTEITMLLTLDDFRENKKLSKYSDTESSRAKLLNKLKPKLEKYAFLCRKHDTCDSHNLKLTTPVNQSGCSNNSMANPLGGPGGSCARTRARKSTTMSIMLTEKRSQITSYSFPPLTGSTTTSPAPTLPMMPVLNRNPIISASFCTSDFLMSSKPIAPALSSHDIIQNWNDFASHYMPDLLTSFNPTTSAPAPPMMSKQDRNPITFPSFCTPNPLTSSNPTIPFQPASASHVMRAGGLVTGSSTVPHQAVSSQPLNLNFPAVDVKRRKHSGTVEKVNDSTVNIFPHMHACDLPQTAIVNFYQGSKVQSLDFHPVQQTLLLVGTANGDVSIWEMGGTNWLVCQPFQIWDIGACSSSVQASFAKDSTAAVNRVIWSPDGDFFGVAYSKHLVHIYSYNGDDLKKYKEIDAHSGNVYDICFSHQTTSLCVITCGEDKVIRMWMADGGNGFSQVFNLVGHEAPVYSLCPCEDEKQCLFSVDTKGKINAWIYDKKVFTCDACPSWGRMACSADGTRLFFCGTDSNGDSFLVEWDHIEGGNVKHRYQGLRKGSMDVVHFDTANNQILAAGDEFQVKFWSMDSVKQMSYTFAAGGLPSCPCVRFNKGGTLLAVSTLENGVKVLANADGLQLLRSMEKCPIPSLTIPIDDIATAIHDDVVGGSPVFSSVGQQSPSFSSNEQPSPGVSSGNSVNSHPVETPIFEVDSIEHGHMN